MPACGAILDLPNPQVDNGYGSGDGSTTNDGQVLVDGQVVGDGAIPDGGVSDGSPAIDSGLCGTKTCFGGVCGTGDVCEPLSIGGTPLLAPQFIAFDNSVSTLYVTAGDKLYGIDVGNYSRRTITTMEPGLSAVVAANGFVYFASSSDSEGTGSEVISRCPSTGCTVASRVDYVPSSNHMVGGIALNSTNFFYTQNDSVGNSGGVYSCGFGGGCSSKLSTANPVTIQTDGANLFWTSGPSPVGFSGCTPSCSGGAGGNIGITDFTIRSGVIYFSEASSINVENEPATAMENMPFYSEGHNILAIAVDPSASAIYWIDDLSGQTGTLINCPIGGCTSGPNALVSGLDNPSARALVVTADSIYYTTQNDNSVWRLAK